MSTGPGLPSILGITQVNGVDPAARKSIVPCHSVIEIGTNSVKMLIAEVDDRGYRQLLNTKVPTRLGEGLSATGRLGQGAISRTVDVVSILLADARGFHPQTVQVIATSAARDASNRDELTVAIASATGLDVRILSGESEGELMYHAVVADSPQDPSPLLLVDLGGGSTQFALGKSNQLIHVSSHKIGTLRFYEHLRLSDQPRPEDLAHCQREVESYLTTEVKPRILGWLTETRREGIRVVGAGGSIRALGKLAAGGTAERPLVNMHRSDIQRLLAQLWALPLHERKRMEGMPRNKADLILVGVVFVDACLAMLGLSGLTVSGRSVRHGVLLRQSQDSQHEKPIH